VFTPKKRRNFSFVQNAPDQEWLMYIRLFNFITFSGATPKCHPVRDTNQLLILCFNKFRRVFPSPARRCALTSFPVSLFPLCPALGNERWERIWRRACFEEDRRDLCSQGSVRVLWPWNWLFCYFRGVVFSAKSLDMNREFKDNFFALCYLMKGTFVFQKVFWGISFCQG